MSGTSECARCFLYVHPNALQVHELIIHKDPSLLDGFFEVGIVLKYWPIYIYIIHRKWQHFSRTSLAMLKSALSVL